MAESSPSRFRVTILGPFEVWREDQPLGAGGWQRSVGTLLKLLVTAPEHRRLRDEVIETLWPDATPEGGANNLRYVLSVLRRSLNGGEPSPILADRTWVTLNPAYSWDIDLVRFEELAEHSAGDNGAMEELAALYRGEPFMEDRYEDWALPLRAHVQQTWLKACRICAQSLCTRHELEPALVWLDRALEIDPLDEESFRQEFQLLIQLGRRSEAIRRFRELERRLRSELDVEPSPETRALLSQAREWRDEPAGTVPAHPSSADTVPRDGRTIQALPRGAYLGSVPTVSLVARGEELARVKAEVDAAFDGQGKLVLLRGEPGVGKTRLAQEVSTVLHQRGFMVTTGRCYEPESAVPYYPFLDVLAAISCMAPGQLRDEVPHRWPYLVRLLPELQPAGVPATTTSHERGLTGSSVAGVLPDGQRDAPLLIRAVAGFLDAVAAEVPLAVLLDDLHWADSASVKLLLHLARHSGGQRVFLLGTYRDTDVTPDHPLHDALIDLGRERLIETITLGRLDSEGTGALIAETLDGAVLPSGLVEIVHGPADGNPFFVGEIVLSMVEKGDLYRKNGAWERRQKSEIHVPESVRAVLGQRLSRLPEETRVVLGAASVLGQTFRFDEVEHVSGLPEAGVEAALDEAVRAGLVREAEPDVYAFSHALAQGAVYSQMTGRRRRRLHLEAAETIEAGSEFERRAAEIAFHFTQAGESGRAIPHLIVAGDAAHEVFAHTEAERHYRSAVEASREIGDAEHEAAALDRLAHALLRQARYPDAQSSAEEAVRIFQRLGDREGELQATCRLADTLQAQRKQRDAFAVLEGVRDTHHTSAISPGLVQLSMRLAELAMELGQYQQQAELTVESVRMANALGDRRLVARAERNRHAALSLLGQPNDVYTALHDYVLILEHDGDLVQLLEQTGALALMALFRGHLSSSREYAERALDLAIRIGDPMASAYALSQLGSSLFLLGDWQGARTHFERAIEVAGGIETATLLPMTLCDLGHLAACEGDWEGGEELLRESLSLLEKSDTRVANHLPYLYLAYLDVRRGRPHAVIEHLTPLLERSGYEEFFAMPLLPPLVHAHVQIGDIERAEVLAAHALRRAESHKNRLDLVAALLAQAQLRKTQGREDEARVILQDAVHHAQEMAFPAAEAEARFQLGALELKSGDANSARSSFSVAREIWMVLGARKDLERVEEALAELPPSPADPTAT